MCPVLRSAPGQLVPSSSSSMSSTFPTIHSPPTCFFRLSASSYSTQATSHRHSGDLCPTLPHVKHCPGQPNLSVLPSVLPLDPPNVPQPFFPVPFFIFRLPLACPLPPSLPLRLLYPFLSQSCEVSSHPTTVARQSSSNLVHTFNVVHPHGHMHLFLSPSRLLGLGRV